MAGICDFCGGEPPSWSYPVRDAAVQTNARLPRHGINAAILQEQTGPWLACETCHDLIEADDYEALAERAVILNMRQGGYPTDLRPAFMDLMRKQHNVFRVERMGEAEPFARP